MKKKYVIIGIITLIIVAFLLVFLLVPTKVTFNDTVEYGSKFDSKDFKVSHFGMDYTKNTKVSGKVNEKKIGEYKVVFSTKIGFVIFKNKQIVKVVDTKKPAIVLKGDSKVTVCPDSEYSDEGAVATDNYDGDISDKIKVLKNENEVIYSVKDSSGNKDKVVRKLVYDDVTKPEIKLNGSNVIYLTVGDQYNELGSVASDNCDGDISSSVVISGKVDTSKIGTYTLTYSVVDKKNNSSSVVREVKVNARGAGGMIYLTFDDGPNQGTTNVILDILKEEGIKATFFVTSRGPDSLIKREYDEGHTVALHTYTHSYGTVYASDNAYFDDLNKISNRVKSITGVESKIIRFPGGSSNTVSKKYSAGIMTRLSKEVENRGYHYFDWNVTSGDAGETKLSSVVYSNVTQGLKKNRNNIVLMHDINTWSRDALRNIIKYGKENGYTFDKITMSTPVYHQKINN